MYQCVPIPRKCQRGSKCDTFRGWLEMKFLLQRPCGFMQGGQACYILGSCGVLWRLRFVMELFGDVLNFCLVAGCFMFRWRFLNISWKGISGNRDAAGWGWHWPKSAHPVPMVGGLYTFYTQEIPMKLNSTTGLFNPWVWHGVALLSISNHNQRWVYPQHPVVDHLFPFPQTASWFVGLGIPHFQTHQADDWLCPTMSPWKNPWYPHSSCGLYRLYHFYFHFSIVQSHNSSCLYAYAVSGDSPGTEKPRGVRRPRCWGVSGSALPQRVLWFASEIVAELLGERQGQDHPWLGLPSAFQRSGKVFSLSGDPNRMSGIQEWMYIYIYMGHSTVTITEIINWWSQR